MPVSLDQIVDAFSIIWCMTYEPCIHRLLFLPPPRQRTSNNSLAAELEPAWAAKALALTRHNDGQSLFLPTRAVSLSTALPYLVGVLVWAIGLSLGGNHRLRH